MRLIGFFIGILLVSRRGNISSIPTTKNYPQHVEQTKKELENCKKRVNRVCCGS
jgi:hypothetical protein